MSEKSPEQMAACAKRELKRRRCDYKNLVNNGVMSSQDAQEQYALMLAIYRHFKSMAAVHKTLGLEAKTAENPELAAERRTRDVTRRAEWIDQIPKPQGWPDGDVP